MRCIQGSLGLLGTESWLLILLAVFWAQSKTYDLKSPREKLNAMFLHTVDSCQFSTFTMHHLIKIPRFKKGMFGLGLGKRITLPVPMLVPLKWYDTIEYPLLIPFLFLQYIPIMWMKAQNAELPSPSNTRRQSHVPLNRRTLAVIGCEQNHTN